MGSTSTPFKIRYSNSKVYYNNFSLGYSVPQMEFFRHFSEEGLWGLLEDIHIKIIDRLTGKGRIHESFWQNQARHFHTSWH